MLFNHSNCMKFMFCLSIVYLHENDYSFSQCFFSSFDWLSIKTKLNKTQRITTKINRSNMIDQSKWLYYRAKLFFCLITCFICKLIHSSWLDYLSSLVFCSILQKAMFVCICAKIFNKWHKQQITVRHMTKFHVFELE